MHFADCLLLFISISSPLHAGESEEDSSILDSAKMKAAEIMKSDAAKKVKEGWEKSKELGKEGWEKSKEMKEKIIGPRTSRDNRRDSFLSLFYEPVSTGLWVPSKSGFLGTWIWDEDWSLEAEYLSGSLGVGVAGVDLIDLSERVVQARLRWTLSNSFNMGLGLGQRSYRFSLGNDYVAKASDYNTAALPSLKVENQVMTFVLGNRWQFDNGITLGVDWFELIATIGQGKVDDGLTLHFTDQKAQDNTRDALGVLRYGPTVAAMKVQLGYTF